MCGVKRQVEENALRKIAERGDWVARPEFKGAGANSWWAAHSFGAYYPCLWTLEKTTGVKTAIDAGKWNCGLRERGVAMERDSKGVKPALPKALVEKNMSNSDKVHAGQGGGNVG